MSERHALILLSLPFFMFFWYCRVNLPSRRQLGFGIAALTSLVASIFLARGFEDYFYKPGAHVEVRRDYAASVVSVGDGRNKRLLVNGVGMTRLTPITKFMAHLPLAFHKGTPASALIVCFGMGTTYRSALSWDIDTTAVELVPSVKEAFGFYFTDADRFIRHPKGKIIIDDGRRYLKRTSEKYDVMVIDPPPPVEAAGSSLLYSKEFYDVAKQHLKPYGVLQTWVPQDIAVAAAALRSVCDSFPHVRYFSSVEHWGLHVLASMEPIDKCTPAQLALRMPVAAKKDLLEWASGQDLHSYLDVVLSHEYALHDLLELNPGTRITDDQAYNEYFLLRRCGIWR
jgi:spermidine synthase